MKPPLLSPAGRFQVRPDGGGMAHGWTIRDTTPPGEREEFTGPLSVLMHALALAERRALPLLDAMRVADARAYRTALCRYIRTLRP